MSIYSPPLVKCIFTHTHSLRGKVKERERYLGESTCYIHSRFFPSFFLGISLLCALPERSLLFVRPIIVVALGLGWAGRLGRLTDGSCFLVFLLFSYRRLVREEDVSTTTTITTTTM